MCGHHDSTLLQSPGVEKLATLRFDASVSQQCTNTVLLRGAIIGKLEPGARVPYF